MITDKKGESYIYGYIPRIVALTGVFLKEKGQSHIKSQGILFATDTVHLATEVENMFSISGSARRLQVAEAAFDHAPKYGMDFNWTDYTVHDAACILLRFLLRLPAPIIPVDRYEAFHNLLEEEELDEEIAMRAYEREISTLPYHLSLANFCSIF